MRRPLAAPLGFAAAAALLVGCAAGPAGHPAVAPAARTARPVVAAAVPPADAAAARSAPKPVMVAEPKPAPEPAPKPSPCRANRHAQLVLVSVTEQHLWMCARGKQVDETAVTTGAVDLPYDSTPIGTFRIQAFDRDTTLTLNTGQTYQVRYWIPFQGPLFGFHDASWQRFRYGSRRYRTHGSHGCVHMPLRAIAFLYRWAHVGTTVTIKA